VDSNYHTIDNIPQHFLNFFPLLHGQKSLALTGLTLSMGGAVSIALVLNISISDMFSGLLGSYLMMAVHPLSLHNFNSSLARASVWVCNNAGCFGVLSFAIYRYPSLCLIVLNCQHSV
jgi:hypothetical protein